MVRIIGLIAFIFLVSFTYGQDKLTWKMLEDVQFKAEEDEETGEMLWYPTFGSNLLMMDESKVAIEGYMIPLDLDKGLYVLSANPFAACFFCGNAGPESVMAIKFVERPRRFDTDEVVKLEGFLELNSTDVMELNYILNQAVEVD